MGGGLTGVVGETAKQSEAQSMVGAGSRKDSASPFELLQRCESTGAGGRAGRQAGRQAASVVQRQRVTGVACGCAAWVDKGAAGAPAAVRSRGADGRRWTCASFSGGGRTGEGIGMQARPGSSPGGDAGRCRAMQGKARRTASVVVVVVMVVSLSWAGGLGERV